MSDSEECIPSDIEAAALTVVTSLLPIKSRKRNGFLVQKVVLIIGLAGASRREKLTNLVVENVKDEEQCVRYFLPTTKTKIARVFFVTSGDVDGLEKFSKDVAVLLKLANPYQYTRHCFRRSSALLLADSGADLQTIKKHGGWTSNRPTVAEGYTEGSDENKKKIA
ncbi:hypothetical protein ANN_08554 [Periplaneta americana]|uniref:Tyr recombinase domain-containing protein n=1 Tax=Periplaneta americana TaxID=6978 RepID=A0ABQ8T1S3_PERAM|nr:hypothetical protein ANN_08554 [Periplaneta americana]